VFRSGNSQAVRLPREARFPAHVRELRVRREGNRLVLEPVVPDRFDETLHDPRSSKRRKETPPDLVLLDERLRGYSGTAFIPEIRALFPSAAVFLVSADPDAAELGKVRGADEARMKPLSLADLTTCVGGLLGRKKNGKRG